LKEKEIQRHPKIFLVMPTLMFFQVPRPCCLAMKHKSIGEGCTGSGSEPSQGGGYRFAGVRRVVLENAVIFLSHGSNSESILSHAPSWRAGAFSSCQGQSAVCCAVCRGAQPCGSCRRRLLVAGVVGQGPSGRPGQGLLLSPHHWRSFLWLC